MNPSPSGNPLVRRIAGVFATRVVQFGLALVTSVVISRMLGPADKGAYVAVVTVPGMLGALGLFGLPSAVTYFAGRGDSVRRLARMSLVATVVLSAILIGLVWVSLPVLESSVLRAAPDPLLRLILIAVPAGMLATFGGAILYGRQAVRNYNLILVGQAVAALVAAIVLIGVLDLHVAGAVLGGVVVSVLLMVAVVVDVRRLWREDRGGSVTTWRTMASYGVRVYPASVTGFFNYRADTYLIQALMVAPGLALGLYSLAVTIAELVFYVPDSIATILLPHVARSTAKDADRIVARVGRLTLLMTGLCALALIPTAIVGINLILPAYRGSLPACFALLPGVVSLSIAKVMTSYLSGRGRPGVVSIGAAVALVLNVSMNLVLIPRLGIIGASLASVVSYTALATMMVTMVARLSGQPISSLFVPGRAEVTLVAEAVRGLARRMVVAVGRAREARG